MIYYNGSQIGSMTYNGSTIGEAYYNGEKVFSSHARPGTVVFESSTPGSYTVDIPATQDYDVIIVGGGAGGSSSFIAMMQQYETAGGGSGALITGVMRLSKGLEVVTVGAGGGVSGGIGYSGSNSSIGNNPAQIARGGAQHSAGGTSAGGTYQISSGETRLHGTNGNAGHTDRVISGKSVAGGASLYQGYGAGGAGRGGAVGTAGANGYVKIVAR